MFKDSYEVVGVMSGTSLDGIDVAHVNFTYSNYNWHFYIRHAITLPYSPFWLNKLKTAVLLSHVELVELNEAYTEFLGGVIKKYLTDQELTQIDAVCSHGHTILHEPQNGYTLQIGNLPKIAKIIGHPVVCDFRVQDVALGGQGAPLVPIGDRLLFSEYEYCLNLGGFSNISFEENGQRIAFDISPVNTILNFYANQLQLDYDDKGTIARSGTLDETLLNELNALPYYHKEYPKSLGIEFVNHYFLPLLERHHGAVKDKLQTLVEHIAFQIAKALPNKKGSMLITGGGAYHLFLIETLEKMLPEMQLIIPDKQILEFKEAMIFGFLGVLKLRQEINVLRSVTGASMDHKSGVIFMN